MANMVGFCDGPQILVWATVKGGVGKGVDLEVDKK